MEFQFLSVCLFVCTFVCLSICYILSVCPERVCLLVHLCVGPYAIFVSLSRNCLFVCAFVCFSICYICQFVQKMSINLCVVLYAILYQFVLKMPVCLGIYVFVHTYTHVCFHNKLQDPKHSEELVILKPEKL